MASLLLAMFPLLHLDSSLTCCCLSFNTFSASITKQMITEAATDYCADSSQTLDVSPLSSSPPSSSLSCSNGIVASALIPSPESCIATAARSIEQRLALSQSSNELVRFPVYVNGTDVDFVVTADADVSYWSALFCQAYGIDNDTGGCTDAVADRATYLIRSNADERVGIAAAVAAQVLADPILTLTQVVNVFVNPENEHMSREWEMVTTGEG